MFGLIRRAIERRRAVRREALRLICYHGREGWHIARDRGRDMSRPESERGYWWRVSGVIERKLEIDWMPDTATRYLEPSGVAIKGCMR